MIDGSEMQLWKIDQLSLQTFKVCKLKLSHQYFKVCNSLGSIHAVIKKCSNKKITSDI